MKSLMQQFHVWLVAVVVVVVVQSSSSSSWRVDAFSNKKGTSSSSKGTLTSPSSSSSSSSPRPFIRYRTGTKADTWPIAWQLGKELMNPLGVQPERFIVAYTTTTTTTNNEPVRVGWAQLRPLSGREATVEQETDDVLWDDFENDSTLQVPVGLQSLPWTKEYREFAAAAADKRRSRQSVKQQVQQETPILYELASVWVHAQWRGQGIGTALVQRVLQRHVDTGGGPLENVYLLTLATTQDWYKDNFGFGTVLEPYIPPAMAFEVQAGKLITTVIGAQLVCMQGNTQAFAAATATAAKQKRRRQ